jgi:hypothetical protein
MTTVIVTDFPADELPSSLRQRFAPGSRVNGTLVEAPSADNPPPDRMSLVELLTGGPTVYKDEAEIVAHMEELRGPRSDD